jgi:DNA helicase HerA-like ATPase
MDNEYQDNFDDDLPAPAPSKASRRPTPVIANGPKAIAAEAVTAVPEGVFETLAGVAEEAGGEFFEPEAYRGSVARTMFDTPQSKDNSLTVVTPSDNINSLPTQSLVRVKSKDGRSYLGVIVEGPFAEPDGMRGDSPIVITVTVAGSIFMPRFHGRVQVEILGEETDNGLEPPRFRPLPNSPVFPLGLDETALQLQVNPPDPKMRLGLVVGYENLPAAIPADKKGVLARHVAVLGTTGGGKTTTVSGMINAQQKAGMATILIDTEGEYTFMNEPTDSEKMRGLLARRGLEASGIQNTVIYHLVGKETTNPGHPRRHSFSLPFANLSPYMVIEILEMSEAQEQRYQFAYDLTKRVLADLRVSPANDEEAVRLLDLDEMETGYPKMTLEQIYDITRACALTANKQKDAITFTATNFANSRDQVLRVMEQAMDVMPKNWTSWLALQGRLGRLKRLDIFDVVRDRNRDGAGVAPLDFTALTTPGQVSIIDLSGTDSPQINNLVIAELLRGVLDCQNTRYTRFEKGEAATAPRTMIVVEEAHEFLSRERIKQMPVLFQQVARIARRGRKRWLGLTFVTQLPQHLPDEVLGLVNNFILHKIADDGVIARLRRTVGGIDDGLWARLPGLAPGQAIVSMTSFARPLLVAMDPAPCRLRMTE